MIPLACLAILLSAALWRRRDAIIAAHEYLAAAQRAQRALDGETT